MPNSPEGFPSSEKAPNPEAGQEVPNFEQASQPEIPQRETQRQPSPDIRLGSGNCWEVLGLPRGASGEQINEAQRRLAMKFHPDRPGGSNEAMKAINLACENARKAAANGESGIAPEAVMAAGAGVAESQMTDRDITPEQMQAAMDAMSAANNLALDESDFYGWHNQERDLNVQHETRMREMATDYARQNAEQAQFNQQIAEMQRKIDAEIAAKKAQEKAEQEKWHRYVFSPEGPDEFLRDTQISALKQIIMPLSESGLLSPQEMNEFMAVGRAVQLEAHQTQTIRMNEKNDATPESQSEKINTCPVCGGSTSSNAKFCGDCGIELTTGETFESRESKKQEVRETAQKLFKTFFTDPSGHNENEARVILGEDFYSARIETVTKAGEDDAAELPPGFAIGMEAQARLTRDGDRVCIKCDNAEFTIGDKKVKFNEICPEGVALYVGADSNHYSFTIGPDGISNEKIFLENFSCPAEFLAMLHEVGHALDVRKRKIKDLQTASCAFTAELLDKSVLERVDAITLAASQERNAWTEGLKIARKIGLSIGKNMRSLAQDCLDTYQQAAENRNVNIGVSNKKRKGMRQGGKDMPVEFPDKCSNCGAVLEQGNLFCSSCGKNLITE